MLKDFLSFNTSREREREYVPGEIDSKASLSVSERAMSASMSQDIGMSPFVGIDVKW